MYVFTYGKSYRDKLTAGEIRAPNIEYVSFPRIPQHGQSVSLQHKQGLEARLHGRKYTPHLLDNSPVFLGGCRVPGQQLPAFLHRTSR